MPYEGEPSGYRSLRRLADNPRVKALLGRARVRAEEKRGPDFEAKALSVNASPWLPNLVLAVDGSHIPVPVQNGFPGATIGYVTIAAVLLDVAKLRALDSNRPVDPQQFRQTETVASIDEAIPGANVVLENEGSAGSSLRRALFEVLSASRIAEDAETLLDTYQVLFSHKPVGHGQECPHEDCMNPGKAYMRGGGEYLCPCTLGRTLYSTDGLRIHEGMEPTGSNGAMFAEIMQVLERLWVIHILRWLERKKWLSTLSRMAIIVDGPLAYFGHPAWLAPATAFELQRLNAEVRKQTNVDMLLVGVEKSGAFVDHLVALDEHPKGGEGRLPPGACMLLDDKYIKKNVVFSDSLKPYGQDTYFGRKLLHKTHSGALVVANSPFLRQGDEDTSRSSPNQYPRLADTLALLDAMISSRFPNSLSPLVAAHAEASIPFRLGTKILEELARKLMPSS